MRALLRLPVGMVLLLLGGCAGRVAEMPTWVGFDEYNDDAVLVLKVEPPASILLAVGNIAQDGWRANGPTSRMWLDARDGFVVARVAATQDDWAYAVVKVRSRSAPRAPDTAAPSYETGFWSIAPAATAVDEGGAGPVYAPAGVARVPVLTATAARVTFAGTIRLEATAEPDAGQAARKLAITPAAAADDMTAVARFMAQHYPRVTARIVLRPLEMMRASDVGG